uniref:Jacalin-type lectin domain-containing protein n=1 Tax=Peronospora matthiolae TaxID=2874970 RepID=A0AAV1T0H6_9STRA
MWFLLLVSIVAGYGATTSDDGDIQLSAIVGGSTGVAFSDIDRIVLGQHVDSVTIRAEHRVTSVTLRVDTPADVTLSHGGSSGTDATLLLAQDEYVQSMEVHWTSDGSNARVVYLSFSTNEGHSVAAGTMTDTSRTISAPEGFQLSGFFGRAADKVTQLGAIWTRRNATSKALTDPMESDWYGYGIRNWVGHPIGDATDSACYRKRVEFGSEESCPLGYDSDSKSCVAQCPIPYPVECYDECLPQNDNCVEEILSKTVSVIATVFNTATAGVFGAMFSSYANAKANFLCAASIIGLMKSLTYFLRFHRRTAIQRTDEELLALAYQSNVVLYSMPIAVANCLGQRVPKKAKIISYVHVVIANIVKQTIINGDKILASSHDVIGMLRDTGTISSTDGLHVGELQDLLDMNSTCGDQLRNLTDYIIASVHGIRNVTPSASINDIRVKMSESPLVLRDIPIATNNCMRELMVGETREAAFQTRDLIRRTLGVIIDQLVETDHTDLGKSVSEGETTLEAANLVLVILGSVDPTRIMWMLSQFVQPTCGPMTFIGEVDDGTLNDALGLKTLGEVFEGSYGTWTKKGDGTMNLAFESVSTKDVQVAIHSGGEKYDRVKVRAGETVKWNALISVLQDTALYLDCWHRNMLGILSNTGSSLVLWIPRSSQGGKLTMHVRVNKS